MKNCNDYSEQLSAYYDGELSESDALKVKEHLAVCDSCSALLELYKEISIAADNDIASVPDALCIGVMNTIKAEDLYGPKKAGEKKSNMRIILTRYMPIAACLAVVLLVWGLWGNMFGLRENTFTGNFSFFGRNDAGDPESSQPIMPSSFDAALPTMLPSADADMGGTDEDIHTRDNMSGQGIAPEGGTNTPLAPPENFPEELLLRLAFSDDGLETDISTSDIFAYLSGASFWITYEGTLPDNIISIFPESLGSWFGWDVIFELPTEDVEFLLDQFGASKLTDDMTGFSVIENESHPDSPYAVVFYFTGDE